MKDDRNYKGYGNNDSNFYWPNKSKLALQFVLNYEEGAENSIMNGDEGSETFLSEIINAKQIIGARNMLSLIHISEPTRLGMISYAVFCLKKSLNNHDAFFFGKS